MRPIHRSKQGFTLIELLVVIAIIAILAGMLVPAITFARKLANRSACGNNQRQIVTALITYTTDNESGWPIVDSSATAVSAATSAAPAAIITGRSFEYLAATLDLSNKLFTCKSQQGPGPKTKPSTDKTRNPEGGATSWGGDGVNTANPMQSYAWDWASLTDSSSVKCITADRNVNNHGDQVQAGFADGHVSGIKIAKGAAAAAPVTVGTNTTKIVGNPDAIGWDDDSLANKDIEDNVFDAIGDQGAGADATFGYIPGKSSRRRAFLK